MHIYYMFSRLFWWIIIFLPNPNHWFDRLVPNHFRLSDSLIFSHRSKITIYNKNTDANNKTSRERKKRRITNPLPRLYTRLRFPVLIYRFHLCITSIVTSRFRKFKRKTPITSNIYGMTYNNDFTNLKISLIDVLSSTNTMIFDA